MDENRFAGAWRLISFELHDSEGQVTYPFGDNPQGYIIYTPNGYMSVSYMPSNRPPFTGDDSMGGSIEEQAAAMSTYRSYCGRYEVQGDRVIHHIEVSLFPNWKGRDQARTYTFVDDRLVLSTPPTLYKGKYQTAHLVWERTA